MELNISKVQAFLDRPERAFLEAIEHLLESSYQVFAKVGLAELLQIQGYECQGQDIAQRIQQETLDFVVIERETSAVLVAIQLLEEELQAKESGLEAALEAAGLIILRLPKQDSYDPFELYNRLWGYIEMRSMEEHTQHERSCPKCHKRMKKYQVRSGEMFGQWMWVCSNHAECSERIPVNLERSWHW
jgi:hypothetical protein